ncbi:MAG: cytosol nonspecific dipeptidase [Chlorobiaceae bacterium]|nr:cytosol nonspecific dipeptidase [Chlorobiaceae bacterium]MBA4309589.1 cytosol nonspecific dipeptidase [Chlorobiaceae bacterium]
MGSVLGHLSPKLVFEHFEEICKYPRQSKKEEKIAEYVVAVGKRNNLETLKDAFGNIVIKKPATKGYENLKTVVLQGHIDMVAEKNRDVIHDFDNDPILPYIDGEWIKAKGTTLGADNGIGVAAALAILEDKNVAHGPLECLFTLDEETGLTGASSLDTNILNAEILLNLDSEELGTLYIGCSGGKNTLAKFSFKNEAVPTDSVAYEIKIEGLVGGHSGLEIHQQRGNAIKILARVLRQSELDFQLRLSEIQGGNKHNAIPREAFSQVTLPKSFEKDFLAFIEKMNAIVRDEIASIENGLKISAIKNDLPSNVMEMKVQTNLLLALNALPHGVMKMSPDIPNLVETSTNLAIIKTENSTVSIVTSQRSSVASEIKEAVDTIGAIFLLAQAEVNKTDGYPGWKPNIHSPILSVFKNTYKNLYGHEPEVKAIHAGLECGIIGEKYPKMDMISFGPTMFGVHSPDEKLLIPTIEPFYELLKNVLKDIPKK